MNSHRPAPRMRLQELKAANSDSKITEGKAKRQPGDGADRSRGGLGDLLGPIGLTIGSGSKEGNDARSSRDGDSGSSTRKDDADANRQSPAERGSSDNSGGGIELGPIALSFGNDNRQSRDSEEDAQSDRQHQNSSIHSMSTAEWRQKFEHDGAVDLWVEEEFNSGSRLSGGRDAFKGQAAGYGSGEGPSSGTAKRHTVTILNRAAGQEMEVEVPEDRYVLMEAEDQGLLLPWACRMGCCTACAVKVISGQLHQPQALGVSAGLRSQGYALMCTSYARSNAVLQVIEEDELYDLQFGEAFEAQALDPNDRRSVLRDDYAIEIADMDE